MSQLPPLPPCQLDPQGWPSDVQEAFHLAANIFSHASAILAQQSGTLHQIRYHASAITTRAIPAMIALEQTYPSDNKLEQWLHQSSQMLGDLLMALGEAENVSAAK